MLKFSKIEIVHLIIAWVSISIIFSIAFGNKINNIITAIPIMFASVGFSFFMHEMAHKFLAERYGAVSEFRADFKMLLVSLLISFTGFIIIAPGAVITRGHLSEEKHGKISAFGPFINIVLGIVFLGLYFLFKNSALNYFFMFSFIINAWLAAFNLLPIPGFDGSKVLHWNKKIYTIMMISAICLFIFQFIV